jgi:large subunit ribosomal protein L18e
LINWHNKIQLVFLFIYLGTGTILLRGPRVREALKHFGRAAGLPGSHAKPYVSHKAKKGRGAR